MDEKLDSPARNLVVCCDGTWNRPDGKHSTNVIYAYDACVADPARRIVGEDDARWKHGGALFELSDCIGDAQWLYYQTGVGSGGSALSRGIEGATGSGIRRNIINAYRWVAANYRDGDRIFLFGFSRGAYTVRSLGGLITRCGLLYPDVADEADNVFELYRQRDLIGASGHISSALINGKARPTPIHFIGVWDTVGALGIPIMGLSFNIVSVWRNQFHDVSLSNNVRHAYHALAMDELRPSFVPTLWEVPKDRPPEYPVEQVWFRGVHSDVGGGYLNIERHLSGVTLDWMMDKARRAGLVVDTAYLAALRVDADARPVLLHDSIGSKWRMLGAWPRGCPIRAEDNPAPSPGNARSLSAGTLHPSVLKLQPTQVAVAGIVNGCNLPIVRLEPGERHRVVLDSAYWWNRTGIALEAGATYEVSCSGAWKDRNTVCDANGWDEPHLLFRIFKRFRRKRDAKWFAATGVVMNHAFFRNREDSVLKGLYYLFIEDPIELTSRQINLGTRCVIRPECDGMLHGFANDIWWLYGNNSGALELEVVCKADGAAPFADFAPPRAAVDTMSAALADVEQYGMRSNGVPTMKHLPIVVDERREYALGQIGAAFGLLLTLALSRIAASAPEDVECGWWLANALGGGLLGWWLLPLGTGMRRRHLSALQVVGGAVLAVLVFIALFNPYATAATIAWPAGAASWILGAGGWFITVCAAAFAFSQSLKRAP